MWEEFVQINEEWLTKYLIMHGFYEHEKVKVRCYSIQFSGNLNDFAALAKYAALQIPEYVFGAKGIKKIGPKEAFMEAMKYFGQRVTKTEGKYGELMLFLFVESVLKCPLVAYKLRSLSNFSDQVKGADGVFLGNYEYQPGKFFEARLIGESKIMESFSNCVTEAYSSLNRFHDKITGPEFMATEFIVAKNNIFDSEDVDIDELYDSLTPGTSSFIKKMWVHPIFIMYETNVINSIETKANSREEAEILLREYLLGRGEEQITYIKEKLNNNPELRKVYLDFFIIPVKSVEKFRNEVCYNIHGEII
ncbi:MAG: DUF1837 domain-containing protein [Sporomusaceae bacterium]|nr:DUF1837 domain-containing protein [Sporomusaceae bacterium]